MPPLLLLADDAPEIVQIVRILARRSGHEIVCCANEDDVLAWLRGPAPRRPDLLLIDLHLSGESGIELYSRLLSTASVLTGVPAALFTQGASAVALAKALDAGMDFIVSKELLVQPEAWKERIDEVLLLVASPAAARKGGKLDARRLAAGVWRALLHPVLGRLEDEGLRALWRRAVLRTRWENALPESDIDVLASAATLAQYVALLVSSCPDAARRLVFSLGYQAECLLGRTPSEPVRAALLAALNEAESSVT